MNEIFFTQTGMAAPLLNVAFRIIISCIHVSNINCVLELKNLKYINKILGSLEGESHQGFLRAQSPKLS